MEGSRIAGRNVRKAMEQHVSAFEVRRLRQVFTVKWTENEQMNDYWARLA